MDFEEKKLQVDLDTQKCMSEHEIPDKSKWLVPNKESQAGKQSYIEYESNHVQ